MKILFLTDNFPPESNAPATRTFEHCKKWVELGYDVTVITCFPNFPKGKIYHGYKNNLFQNEEIDGIKVLRVWSYITSNEGFLKRILDYLSYAFSSFIAGLFIKTNLIIATSPQFFTAISGRALAFFKFKPWIMEVRDLWPDSIVAVGSMNKQSIFFKILKKIENHLYKSASKIIVVTDSFKNYLINYHNIDNNKIGVFKNGIIKNKFLLTTENNYYNLKQNLKLNDKIIISYIGTHGLAHGLKFILKSISKINNQKLHFLFIGDGAEKKNLLEYSLKLKSKNFTFLESVPKNDIRKYISISDFALVNLKKSDEFKNVIPSKIFENVAMYKPILLGLEGESKILIQTYDVGVAFKPEDEKSFFDALERIQKIDFKKFRLNCDKMVYDFDREKIAYDLIKFISKTL